MPFAPRREPPRAQISRQNSNRLVVRVAAHRRCVRMLHPLELRMYIHHVSSRHWPSPLTHQDAARIAQGLLLTSSRMAKSQKKPGGLRPIIVYILRKRVLFSNTSSMSGRGSTTTVYPGDPEKGERSSLFRVLYWLGPPLIRACVRPTICPASSCSARLHPAAAGSRLQARRSSEDGARAPNHLSICHRPARVPFAARLDARALRRSCARTPKSGQLVPALRPTDGAECVRVQVWRRRRRRSAPRGATDAECGASACGLTPKEEAAAAAATEATCARHRRHATVSSASLPFAMPFAFPVGARAIGRVGARRFDAAGVSNAIVASPPGACAYM